MQGYSYEVAHISKPLLPFIYYSDCLVKSPEFAPNWHQSIEILQCTKGFGYARTNSETHEMHPGDIVVINSDVFHSTGSPTEFHYRCLIIDTSFCLENGIHISDVWFQSFIRDPSLVSIMDQIDTHYQHAAESAADCLCVAIRYHVLGLLYELLTNYLAADYRASSTASTRHVQKAVTFIRNHYTRSLTLDEIAENAGINKFQLSREYIKITGTTLFDTINQLRCMTAKQLLADGASVTSAAVASGYENISYFTRIFKKYFGCTPSTLMPKKPR